MRKWALLFLLTAGIHAHACESARLRFEGTAFAKTALQMEGDKIYLFRGTPHETSISYFPQKKQWCYIDSEKSSDRPSQGCMSRKGKKQLTIDGVPVKEFNVRNLKQKTVATVSVLNNLLTLNFLGEDQQPLGKRLVFKSVTRANGEFLEAKGWNCPNPRYLSCVGADLTSVTSFEGEPSAVQKVQAVELSKRLGHYRLSCEGAIEHFEK